MADAPTDVTGDASASGEAAGEATEAVTEGVIEETRDPLAPYANTREHLVDEIALVRARSLSRIGERQLGTEQVAAAPDPRVVAQRVGFGLATGADLRLPHLESTFGLSSAERAVLLTAIAAEVDPIFRAVCRGTQGELAGPTLQVGTIVELCTGELDAAIDATLLFLPEGKLRANALITVDDPPPPRDVPLQALRVKASRSLCLYLLGERASSAPAWVRTVVPEHTLPNARLPSEKKQELLAHLRASRERGQTRLVEIAGPDGVGKRYLAEGLCAELGKRLLVVDCRAMNTGDRDNLRDRLAEVRREALLFDAAPYLDHYETLFLRHTAISQPQEQDNQSQQVQPSVVLKMPQELLDFLQPLPLVFVGAPERFEPLEDAGEVLRITLDFPTPSQRSAIWDQAFVALGAERDPDLDLSELGRKLALDARRIHAAARAALSSAELRRNQGQTDSLRVSVNRLDVMEASRHQLQHDLKSLAARIDKAYRWEDLVISVEGYHSLMEMISYAKNAEQVYDKWGFGEKHSASQGISALFSGPPGTGKTMCASILARQLDMELFRVDLSRVVSKWIGETEKNLARVFDEAERSHAVVLFDEADSLFAKRTEVKSSVDRYANLEVNFLLQRMESFTGVTILTTNFEDTIDTAFKRRLSFRIRFEKPDADARAALWSKMFPPQADLADDVDFDEIGRRFEISGGNIRNAAIRAAFLAVAEEHPIDKDCIVRATLKESREMGLLVFDETPRGNNGFVAGDPRNDDPATDEETIEEEDQVPEPKKPSRMVPLSHPRR